MDEQALRESISPEKMAGYRQGARRRRESDELQRQMRVEQGWKEPARVGMMKDRLGIRKDVKALLNRT